MKIINPSLVIRIFILSLIFINITFLLSAQRISDRSSSTLPLWIGDKPQSKNYLYYIGFAEGTSLQKTQELAVSDVLYQLSNEASVTISVETLSKVKNETVNGEINFTSNFEAITKSTGEKITIKGLRKEEEYWQRRGDKYEYWILMRKPKREGIDPVYDAPQGYGMKAIWRSALVPGWGQLYKKQKKKGYITLCSEVVAISGILVAQSMYNTNIDKASETQNYQSRKNFLSNADSWETIRNVSAIAAGAIYIYSLIDAAASKGAKRYAFLPQNNFEMLPVFREGNVELALSIKF